MELKFLLFSDSALAFRDTRTIVIPMAYPEGEVMGVQPH